MVEKSVSVAAVVASVVGVEEEGEEEESGGDGKKPNDGGWRKGEPSATATAVGLGATPVVLLLPLVDADIEVLS